MENSNEKAKYYDKQPKLLKSEPSKLKEHMQKGMTAFIVVAASMIFFFILLRFTNISDTFKKIVDVTMPIIYGFVIAFLLNPIMKKIEVFTQKWLGKVVKREKLVAQLSKIFGVFGSLIFGIAIVVALLNMLIPELYKSISGLVETLPQDIEAVITKYSSMEEAETTVERIIHYVMVEGGEWLETWIQNDLLPKSDILVSKLTGGVLSVVYGLVDILVGLMASIYILFSKEKFMAQAKKIIYAFMKPKRANTTLHICRKANEIFTGFIIGKIIDSAIIGVLCFIGLSILKMPHVLLVSVIVGVTNVIPVFGPYIGAVPGIILIALVNPMQGLYFAIFILALQQLDGNVIGPAILGDSTGLSPFWVIFSIVVGGGLFGILGMFIGVPTFALIYYIIKMFIHQKLESKKLPSTTDYYTTESYVDDNGVYVSSEKEEVKEN